MRKDLPLKKQKSTRNPKPEANWADESSRQLFEELRALRLNLAREQELPPYMIFHYSTLREMVELRPTSLREFSHLSGVGKTKLERYGEQFLEVLVG